MTKSNKNKRRKIIKEQESKKEDAPQVTPNEEMNTYQT
jgi:hypothetical protein